MSKVNPFLFPHVGKARNLSTACWGFSQLGQVLNYNTQAQQPAGTPNLLPVYTTSILSNPVKHRADPLITTHTHTHTHKAHIENKTTKISTTSWLSHNLPNNPFCPLRGHWHWILISPAKMAPTIICQVGIHDYTLTPLHSPILPLYYSVEGTLFPRSFLNVLCAF